MASRAGPTLRTNSLVLPPEVVLPEQSLSASLSVKRKVPGSFSDADEDGDMDEGAGNAPEAEEEEEEVATACTTRSRQPTSPHSTTTCTHKKPRSKRTESKDCKNHQASLRPSLPTALVDDEQVEDHIAPLRSTKTSSRKLGIAATGKLPCGSAASDLGDELAKGVQARRRSSWLSAAVSSGNVAGESEVSLKKSARRCFKKTYR